MFKKQAPVFFIAISLLLLVSLLVSLMLGTADISINDMFKLLVGDTTDNAIAQTIIWQIRLPRLLSACLVGAGLAVAGAILQNTTRNPLADPYLFGLMAGAGLGATVVSLLLPAHFISIAIGAFIGAMLAVILVFAVCIGSNWRKPEISLLAGVAVSFMLSALTSFILYFAEPFAANRVIFWLLGSLSATDWQSVKLLAPLFILVLSLALALRRQLDALLLSDDSAQSLGVNTVKLRLVLIVATALLTAAIVAQSGGIAFVGLMVPHIARQLLAVTATKLLLGSALLGAVFMLWVDNLARVILPHQEIPLGVVTSFIGSIFFLILMRRQAN
ncbi:FecCD family ABC transporter permease [Rheinheimera sp. WS51]|uniref:FecCD family ABC transporter permease n=1 Tax=Rheinheimera sp. WS51 TaxID=3425886 RepID=UPI003D91348A